MGQGFFVALSPLWNMLPLVLDHLNILLNSVALKTYIYYLAFVVSTLSVCSWSICWSTLSNSL